MNLKNGSWILVADGEKALFLKNEGGTKRLNLKTVHELEQINPPTHLQGTERPGRHSDGPSPHNSAYEETDWHRLNKERFAVEISDLLYKCAHDNEFDQIVLIAPPQTLGEIRKHLHPEVISKVTQEINKTLTNLTVCNIEEALKLAP